MTTYPAGSPEARRVVRDWLAQNQPRTPVEDQVFTDAYRASYDRITPRPRTDTAKRRAQAIARHDAKRALAAYRSR